jgi:peptide/nickel transport system substrate-binding protein
MRFFPALAFLVAAVGACSGTSDGNKPRTSGTLAPAHEGRPKYGGTVVYGLEAETLGGWCLPVDARLAAGGIEVASAIYDTLTVPNDKGEYVPYLAQTVEHNDNYTEWTVTVRPEIKFHNGEPLNADIVKRNLDEFRKGQLFSQVLADVTDVQVTGPLSVKVTNRIPWVAFPAFLWSTGRLGISAAEQLDAGQDCRRKLIGTGPFKFVSWSPNYKLVVEKSPDYWQRDERGNKLPYLDRIEFRPVPLVSQLINGLKSGELNLIQVTDGKAISQLRSDSTVKLLESTRAAEIAHTMLNTATPPFNNRDARLALAYALNPAELNRVHEAGVNKLATQPYAPETLGYQPDPGYPKFNLTKARDEVERYKQQTGQQELHFALATTPDPETQALAASWKSQMARAGIAVDIPQATEQSQYIAKALAGDYQAIIWRNFPGGDPDTLYVWWHSTAWNPRTNAFDVRNYVNFGRISDPQIDKDLEAARSQTDPEARKALYQDIGAQFAKNAYVIWHWYATWGFASTVVNGVVGPRLPNGDPRGLPIASVQPVVGLWRS